MVARVCETIRESGCGICMRVAMSCCADMPLTVAAGPILVHAPLGHIDDGRLYHSRLMAEAKNKKNKKNKGSWEIMERGGVREVTSETRTSRKSFE